VIYLAFLASSAVVGAATLWISRGEDASAELV
jgi:hypothetical protein